MKLKNEPVVAYKEHLNAMKTDWTISYNRLCIFCRVLQPKNLFKWTDVFSLMFVWCRKQIVLSEVYARSSFCTFLFYRSSWISGLQIYHILYLPICNKGWSFILLLRTIFNFFSNWLFKTTFKIFLVNSKLNNSSFSIFIFIHTS